MYVRLYLRVNGRSEVAEQSNVVLLTGLHVHHQTRVQVTESRRLSKRLVQHHLPICCFTVGARKQMFNVHAMDILTFE